jgi:hypothetical protein
MSIDHDDWDERFLSKFETRKATNRARSVLGRFAALWLIGAIVMAGGDEVKALDASWAELAVRARQLVADLKQTEAEADELLLDLTRVAMAGEK